MTVHNAEMYHSTGYAFYFITHCRLTCNSLKAAKGYMVTLTGVHCYINILQQSKLTFKFYYIVTC
jgi:hypothetical protein